MTTPRDAIADLIKELRWPRNIRSPDDLPEQVRLRQAAATALDALQARVKELEAADRYANLISIIADIREKSGLGGYPMLSELADAIGSKLADAESRATSAEQERDEAYERAAKVAESAYGGKAHTYASENADVYRAQDEACAHIAAAIRRLAAGIEKEKRE